MKLLPEIEKSLKEKTADLDQQLKINAAIAKAIADNARIIATTIANIVPYQMGDEVGECEFYHDEREGDDVGRKTEYDSYETEDLFITLRYDINANIYIYHRDADYFQPEENAVFFRSFDSVDIIVDDCEHKQYGTVDIDPRMIADLTGYITKYVEQCFEAEYAAHNRNQLAGQQKRVSLTA